MYHGISIVVLNGRHLHVAPVIGHCLFGEKKKFTPKAILPVLSIDYKRSNVSDNILIFSFVYFGKHLIFKAIY